MKILSELFAEAKEKSFINYVFTILRVQGLSSVQDPILTLKEYLNKLHKKINISEKVKFCESIIEIITPLELILNLYNCTQGKEYDMAPFMSLSKGQFPNIVKPELEEIVSYFNEQMKNSNYKEISGLIVESYFHINVPQNSEEISSNLISKINNRFNNIKSFIDSFLKIYVEKRFEFKNLPIYYKLPHFMVMELLLDSSVGLLGFKMHFSNGNDAKFTRLKDRTDTINISLGTPIEFFVGNLEDLVDEWKVGNKRLFEIGLKGKYNKTGEWRPLVHPGKYDHLENEARKFSNDPNIQSLYFYILCTGHRVIEFVVAMDIEFPMVDSILGEKFFFHKCDNQKRDKYKRTTIYDCWVELESTELEYIESVVNTIKIAVNRIAFTYEIKAKWSLKYAHNLKSNPQAKPSVADLKLINEILEKFPSSNEGFILDAAIDWYNQGKQSKNYFTSFLCYYIALESIAIAIVDNKIDFGLDYEKPSKKSRIGIRNKCIDNLLNKYYDENPTKFVQEAYFDCIVGLKQKTKKVLQLVFGEEHKYIGMLFEKHGEYSLSEIRSKLAHGEFTALNENEKTTVKESVYQMEIICNDFLKRLVLNLMPDEELPNWSQEFVASISFDDPRSIFIANQDKMFANKNWSIREEWID